jgi:hypothetical protein
MFNVLDAIGNITDHFGMPIAAGPARRVVLLSSSSSATSSQ